MNKIDIFSGKLLRLLTGFRDDNHMTGKVMGSEMFQSYLVGNTLLVATSAEQYFRRIFSRKRQFVAYFQIINIWLHTIKFAIFFF